jgi:acyl-CoA thioesterase-1
MKFFAVFIAVLLVSLTLLAVFLGAFRGRTIRVACVGDSITELTTYPTDLQELLGCNYYVREFGVTGSTVLANSYNPYIYQPKFQVAKEFRPDIVVILLGTNDARVGTYDSIDNFVADYKQLVSEVQELETNPKILLMTPPPLFENNLDLYNESLLECIIPGVEQVAEDLGLTTIDVYTPLAGHPECFVDGVHPNYDGARVIASRVYKAILTD